MFIAQKKTIELGQVAAAPDKVVGPVITHQTSATFLRDRDNINLLSRHISSAATEVGRCLISGRFLPTKYQSQMAVKSLGPSDAKRASSFLVNTGSGNCLVISVAANHTPMLIYHERRSVTFTWENRHSQAGVY